MNVLVTGGTGFVGSEVMRELRRAGHTPHALTRNTHSTKALAVGQKNGFRPRQGNILDPASLNSACAGVEGIVHLVGIIGELGDQTFENVHTRGTENIIAAAREAGIKRFVYMSALGTRPDA